MSNPKRWRVPAVDVLEAEDSWRLIADVPRATRQSLDLTVHEGALRIRAEVNETFGYERLFRLPRGVDAQTVQASLDGGVLTLTVPKPQEVRPQRIAVA
jgi:HSP20 family protein